jgi:hypothetical protein
MVVLTIVEILTAIKILSVAEILLAIEILTVVSFVLLFYRGLYKSGKKRMRPVGPGFEFRMEL